MHIKQCIGHFDQLLEFIGQRHLLQLDPSTCTFLYYGKLSHEHQKQYDSFSLCHWKPSGAI